MLSFSRVLILATIVAVSSATVIDPILKRAANAGHHCPGAKVLNETEIDVHGKKVTLTKFQCAHPTGVQRRQSAPTNVCGVRCSITCNNLAGPLPPITDDCDQIKDAIQIFGDVETTFVVPAYGLQALTYGTCTYSFKNNYSGDYEYCWADLSTTASRSGSACFPPKQPLFSEGLCTSRDLTWAVAAAHS